MRVLIVRLGAMGDVLHALPVVAALRAAYPDAHIGWAIERRWTPFLVCDGTPLDGPRTPQRPLVDRVHVVDTFAWRRAPLSDATWADIRNSVREIKDERYDLAIDFQGSIKSATIALFSGAPSRLGFATPREKPASLFYTSTVQPSGRHIIDQNLSLLSSAFPSCSFVPSVVTAFPLDPTAALSVPNPDWGWKGEQRFAILNPGAGWLAKQWPASRYGEVARALRGEGILSLVNHGPAEETLAREVESASEGSARSISCSLAELIALTRRSSLFIGGDTGPMHLAAALDVPVVALFGPTDPVRNGPYAGLPLAGVARAGMENSIILRHTSSRTSFAHSSAPDPGLLQITADEVLEAARHLLARNPQPDGRSQQ